MGIREPLPIVMPPLPRDLLDRIGTAGSLLCAIHCALLPLAIAVLPSLGLALWLGDGVETGFVLFASVYGLAVLSWSYRHHRALRALALLVPGLAALWLGVLVPALHHALLPHAVLMTTGGTLVGLSHWVNLRLHHDQAACRTCAGDAC